MPKSMNTKRHRASSALKRRRTLEMLEDRRVLAAVSFIESIAYDGGIGRSQFVETADLDGDGDADAVAQNANELAIFLNDGSGGFGDPIPSDGSLAEDIRALTLGDFDGDGDIDAVTGSFGDSQEDHSTVALFTNDGSGNLKFATTLLTSLADTFIDDVTSGDLDNDGDVDVVAAGRGSSQVFYFENTGSGTFAAPAIITGDFLEPRAVHVTDMDGDGDLDVIGTSSYDDSATHNVFWFENTDGDATFGATPASIVDTGRAPRFLDSADLDGDGDMDLAVPLQFEDELVIIENTDGLGTLGAPFTLATELPQVERVQIDDLDGDSDPDIVATVDAGDAVIWFENTNGQGAFSDFNFVSDDTPHASGLSLTDLDGDGDVDMMTTSQFSSGVSAHVNDGGGLFETTIVTKPNAFEPHLISLADLDGDGDRDLIGQSETDFELAWYENAGDGTFGPQNIIDDYNVSPRSATIWWDIKPADMDGDGDMDLVASTPNLVATIIWYENTNGEGEFGETHTYTGMTEFGEDLAALEFNVVDFDGDGDIDVIATQANNDAGIGLYENTDGMGTLEATSLIAIDGHAFEGDAHLATGDVDGDGDVDILIGDNNENDFRNIVWYENVAGTLTQKQVLLSEVQFVDDVTLADMDSDGDLDAVVSSILDDQSDSLIEWYENTDGAGTFGNAGTMIGEQFFVAELTVADVDGDGDQDVISPDLREGFIEIFDNEGMGASFQEYHVNAESYGPGNIARSIGMGDISGDGRIDIVAGNESGNAYVAYIAQPSASPYDLDNNGEVEGDDAILLCQAIRSASQDLSFDLNNDGIVNSTDMVIMMRDGLDSSVGDSNFDGIFGTADLVLVFQASQYEDAIDGNSTWATGDWNCDGDFTTLDLVFVFQNGTYDSGAPAVPNGTDSFAGSVGTNDTQDESPNTRETSNDSVDFTPDRDVVARDLSAAEVDQLFERDDDSVELIARDASENVYDV